MRWIRTLGPGRSAAVRGIVVRAPGIGAFCDRSGGRFNGYSGCCCDDHFRNVGPWRIRRGRGSRNFLRWLSARRNSQAPLAGWPGLPGRSCCRRSLSAVPTDSQFKDPEEGDDAAAVASDWNLTSSRWNPFTPPTCMRTARTSAMCRKCSAQGYLILESRVSSGFGGSSRRVRRGSACHAWCP